MRSLLEIVVIRVAGNSQGQQKKLNKIAQGDFSLFSPLTFFSFGKIFIGFTKYYQIRNLRVRISGNRHFTCQIHKKFKDLLFWRPFCHFFVNAVSHNSQSYQPILLILNSKQGLSFSFTS